MAGTSGFDREAFDKLLKEILMRDEAAAAPAQESQKAPPAPEAQQSASSPASAPEPLAPEQDAAARSPVVSISPAPEVEHERAPDILDATQKLIESAKEQTAKETQRIVTDVRVVQAEIEDLKRRLADMEATHRRLIEEIQRLREQAAEVAAKQPALPVPATVAAAVVAPPPTPVAVVTPVAPPPEVKTAVQPARKATRSLLAVLRRLFPSFFPSAGETAARPAKTSLAPTGVAAPHALYQGHIEIVTAPVGTWARLIGLMEQLAALPGARVRGLFGGPKGDAVLALDLETPATLKQIQAAAPDMGQLQLLAPQQGATRFTVTFA